MERQYSLSDLDLIGISEVPVLDQVMPRILSPIFEVRESGEILFPPYTKTESSLVGPHVADRQEFEELSDRELLTQLPKEVARSGFEVWIDDRGEIRYQDQFDVNENLGQIRELRTKSAEAELMAHNWDRARLDASVAYSADPDMVDSLVIRSVAETKLGKDLERRITEDLAAELISPDNFRALTNSRLEALSLTSPTIQMAREQSTFVMFNQAARRPKVNHSALCLA